MHIIDCSKSISKEILKNYPQWNGNPNGFNYVKFSEPRTFKAQFLWFKPKDHIAHFEIFEIWDGSTICILEECWDRILPIITPIIKKFEIETGQMITVKKVDYLRQFSDY